MKNFSKSEKSTIEVDFKVFFDSVTWDSIAIVYPYMNNRQLNNIDYCNAEMVADEMREVASVDWKYGLFFIRKNCFVGYTIISANPGFRFSKSDASLPLIRKTEAVVRLRKVRLTNNETDYFFQL